MSGISSISLSGLQSAMARMDASASRTARAVVDPQVDLASEMVEQITAKLAFQANAKVIGADYDLQRRSLEIWA